MLWVQGHEAVLLLMLVVLVMVPQTLRLPMLFAVIVVVSLWMVALTRISQTDLLLAEVHQ